MSRTITDRIAEAMNGQKDRKLTVRDEVVIKNNLAIYYLWGTPIVVKDRKDNTVYVNLSSNMDEGNYYPFYGRRDCPPISKTTRDRINALTDACLTQYNWQLYEGYPSTKEAKDRALETDCWYEVTDNGLKQLQPQLKLEGLVL